MISKLKGIFKAKDDGDQEFTDSPDENNESGGLQGISKYLVVGLGVVVMLGGIGFALTQVMSGGSSHQMMSQPPQQQQSDANLQTLREQVEREQSEPEEGSAQGPAQGTMTAQSETDKDGAAEKKTLDKPSQEPSASPMTSPEMTAGTSATPSSPSHQPSAAMDEMLDKLESIEASVGKSMGEIASAMGELRHGLAVNGDRIEALSDKVQDISGSGVDAERHTRVVFEKEGLEIQISELQEQVEDLEGRYKWVRHLEREKSAELKNAKEELESARFELSRLQNRPVFGEWKLAGLTENEILLMNPYSGQVKRMVVGESFQGVEVQKINTGTGTVTTNAGEVSLS